MTAATGYRVAAVLMLAAGLVRLAALVWALV
jgi:hypothetical protein